MTAIRDGVRGKDKLDVPIKFIWNYAGNTLVNQHSDINKTHEILQDESKCEMIVVIENFMTSSAKYADILLPDLMTVEQEDIIPNDYAVTWDISFSSSLSPAKNSNANQFTGS